MPANEATHRHPERAIGRTDTSGQEAATMPGATPSDDHAAIVREYQVVRSQLEAAAQRFIESFGDPAGPPADAIGTFVELAQRWHELAHRIIGAGTTQRQRATIMRAMADVCDLYASIEETCAAWKGRLESEIARTAMIDDRKPGAGLAAAGPGKASPARN